MIRFLLLPLAVILSTVSLLPAQDWPSIRGPNRTGNVATENGILTTSESFQFNTRWKRKLGSGYSSVVVADGKVVTMYTDGIDDRVICLNASDGETIWDFSTGPMFKGENGSFDGPLSTPLLHDNRAYVITAVGTLHCLNMDNGEEQWSFDLPKETGVKKPLYGFVTSPIVVGEILIVQAGGPEKSLVGLDRNSGKVEWAVGTDVINSQTPSTIVLGDGEPTLVLAAGGKNLSVVDPKTGTVLLEHEHKGGNGQAMTPVDLGDGNVLMTLDDRHSTTIKLTPQSDTKVTASPQWQERSIKNTYNIPVLCNGGVFAYSTRILTCVNPETGRPFWKTREPGDGFLITVDGYLIINTKKGSLHLAKASQEKFQDLAELDLFKDLVWSVPAYSDNSIFARSLGEIARVDIFPSEEKTAVAETEVKLGKEFSKFLTTLEESEDNKKSQLVDQWIESQGQFPKIENGIAHFVYRGEESDVALAGDFLGARQEKKMTRVEGTDFHYLAIEFESDQRANYCLLLNYQPTLDPLNKRQMTSTMYAGEMEFAVRLRGQEPLKMSWFSMSEWKQPDYLSELGEVEVNIETYDVPTNEDGDTTKINVLLPPGIENSEQAYPVAYVFDGGMGRPRGDMDKALTKLFGDVGSQAAIVVFLEGGGPEFTEVLASRIVPFIDEKYTTIAERESRLVVGFGFSGTPALVTCAAKNDVFGIGAAQSPLAFADAERMILQTMSGVKNPTKVHLQWGRFDMFNPHENWDLRTGTEKLFKGIAENENVQVTGGMVNDSTDWSSWRNRYHEIFGLFKSED